MIELGIRVEIENKVTGFGDGAVELTSIYRDGPVRTIDCASLIVVGTRKPNDAVYRELMTDTDALSDAGVASVRSIGDCRAPGAIAHAVYSGHECARTIDSQDPIGPILWERPRFFEG